MAKLKTATSVTDPDRPGVRIHLLPGEEPEPRIAALITNPDCWEDSEPPAAAKAEGQQSQPDQDGDGDQPTPAKKTAARKTAAKPPARGREAAEGDGSQ